MLAGSRIYRPTVWNANPGYLGPADRRDKRHYDGLWQGVHIDNDILSAASPQPEGSRDNAVDGKATNFGKGTEDNTEKSKEENQENEDTKPTKRGTKKNRQKNKSVKKQSKIPRAEDERIADSSEPSARNKYKAKITNDLAQGTKN